MGGSGLERTDDFQKICRLGTRSDKTSSVQDSGWTGFGAPESTPVGFRVFLSHLDPESDIWEKPDPDPESILNFGISSSLFGHF